MIVQTPSGVGMLTRLIDADGLQTADPREAEALVAKLLDGPYEGQFFAGTVDTMGLPEVH
jgi:hypothetical protein